MTTFHYRGGGRLKQLAVAFLVLLALIAIPARPSAAAPTAPGAKGGPSKSVDAGENDKALRHWTEERMRHARPASPGVISHGQSPTQPTDRGRPFDVHPLVPPAGDKALPDADSADTGPPSATTTAPVAPEVAEATSEGYWQSSNTANPNAQIGRLFYQTWNARLGAWVNSSCSASVVNSENKSVVWTAGHCVYQTYSNLWNRYYVFCPGYRNGSCPFGRWTPYSQSTTTQWQNAVCTSDGRCTLNEFNYDLGALKMNTLNGYRIAVRVGAQGIRFNGATYQYRYMFGYPGNKSNGEYLYYCVGSNTYSYGNLRLSPCSAGPGASGGPWLSEVASSWLGYVHSVNSHGDGTFMAGPYQGIVAQNLYAAVRY